MKRYNLEFSWNVKRHITLVVTSHLNNTEELIGLSNELHEKYTKDHDGISFYFFIDRENAIEFVYRRFVLNDFTISSIENSSCKGYLENNELFELFSPPKLIKVYNTENDTNEIHSNPGFSK